ncbi:transposase [Sinorhizobium meliloti]|nr:transposase [Sinorhizobium meliloti]
MSLRNVVRRRTSVYPGSVHDKTIWNGEFAALPKDVTVLADKAYAGGAGEGEVLFRPVKRNEQAWKRDPGRAKSFNAALSKRRVRIEHLFAQLKTWRIIHHYYPMRPQTYGTTFMAIAYIHNLNKLEKTGKLM